MDDDYEFVAERGAFERVSFRGGEIDVRTPLGSLLYSLNEKFDALQYMLNLLDSDRYVIQQIGRGLPDPQYKNAAAIVYAYYVTKGGRISQSALQRTLPLLHYGVQLGDVLRYARLLLGKY